MFLPFYVNRIKIKFISDMKSLLVIDLSNLVLYLPETLYSLNQCIFNE